MANDYSNRLRVLLNDPGSFQADPGYGWMRDQALEATNRSNSRQRGSFNALAALNDRASGLAGQAYDTRIGQLTQLSGQADQYDLGTEANRLTGARDAGNLALGHEQNANTLSLGNAANANTSQRNAWDYELGKGGLDNSRRAADQNFGLGMYRADNDYSLGAGQNANTAQNNWWNYKLGSQQNANTAANNQNNYNLGAYSAATQRGTAQSNDWWNQDQSAQNWRKLNPPRMMF